MAQRVAWLLWNGMLTHAGELKERIPRGGAVRNTGSQLVSTLSGLEILI
jgi:hypothetical protein